MYLVKDTCPLAKKVNEPILSYIKEKVFNSHSTPAATVSTRVMEAIAQIAKPVERGKTQKVKLYYQIQDDSLKMFLRCEELFYSGSLQAESTGFSYVLGKKGDIHVKYDTLIGDGYFLVVVELPGEIEVITYIEGVYVVIVGKKILSHFKVIEQDKKFVIVKNTSKQDLALDEIRKNDDSSDEEVAETGKTTDQKEVVDKEEVFVKYAAPSTMKQNIDTGAFTIRVQMPDGYDKATNKHMSSRRSSGLYQVLVRGKRKKVTGTKIETPKQ